MHPPQHKSLGACHVCADHLGCVCLTALRDAMVGGLTRAARIVTEVIPCYARVSIVMAP